MTRTQLITFIRQNITDPLLRQNTAPRVRASIELLATQLFNAAEDVLPQSSVTDLVTALTAKANLINGQVSPTELPAPRPLYDILGIHTDGPATQRLVNEVADAAVRVPNLRPVGHAVTADYVSTPGWGTGSSSLADLPVDTLFIGTTAIAIYSVAGRFRTYVVADDPQGPLSVYRDGRLSGTRIAARWVLNDAPQAVATPYASIDGAAFIWKLQQLASAYVGSPATIQYFQARTAAVHPAPTEGGDAVHWEPISPQSITAPNNPQPATATRAGIVKIGSGVAVATDGTISVAAPPPPVAYPGTGQATDGYITQQGTTNELAKRFRNRGAWLYNGVYSQNDVVYVDGFTYYKSTEGTAATTTFNKADWVAFGLNEYATNRLIKLAVKRVSAVSLPLETTVPQVANTTGQSFIARPSGSYFFAMGGEITMNYGGDPDPNYAGYDGFGQVVSVRLKKYNTKPLLIKTTGDNYIKNFIIAPGETVILAYTDVNTSAVQYPGEYGGSGGWILISRSGGEVITAIQPAAFTGIVAVDFLAPVASTINANSNLAYNPSINLGTGPNNDAVIGTQEHYITNTSGTEITLSFPAGWTFFPGPAPTKLAAGKQALLTIKSLGNSDNTVKAAYIAQA